METPIKIFVGTPANNEDLECQCVLDYSLRKFASQPLDITWMMLSRDPNSIWYSDGNKGWNTKGWATPFSPLRWAIPAACKFQGRAIYMDCDMIALADIAELWNQPIPPGKGLLAKGGQEVVSCVMLFDCAAMHVVMPTLQGWMGKEGEYRHVRRLVRSAAADYKDDWNCRDGENCKSIYEPHVKILHYTRIPTQPNHKYARERLKREGKAHWFPGPDQPHPKPEVTELFDRMYQEAIAAGRGPEAFRVDPEFGAYGR